ncbi:hypothetical protein FRC16_004317 [Serendipita sp. 398]|nr:hypothetical protein FRC16_004317 [Serendipita sp. 398]
MTTRRATMTRGHRLNSSATAATFDEMGTLGEKGGGLSEAETLRRELDTYERENSRLRDQILSLQALLAQRPSAEELKNAKETVRNVELLLAGANKENERAMMENERANRRVKILEDELARLAGENWQTTLDLAPTGRASLDSPERPTAPSVTTAPPPTVTAAYLEQMRLLIIGMETHLQAREEELNKTISMAEDKEKQLQASKKAELLS